MNEHSKVKGAMQLLVTYLDSSSMSGVENGKTCGITMSGAVEGDVGGKACITCIGKAKDEAKISLSFAPEDGSILRAAVLYDEDADASLLSVLFMRLMNYDEFGISVDDMETVVNGTQKEGFCVKTFNGYEVSMAISKEVGRALIIERTGTPAASPSASTAPLPSASAAPSANAPAANAATITLAEFNQLQNGMTYEQACAIIGGEGNLLAESGTPGTAAHTVMYTWSGEGGIGANANAMFQGGKLMSKAQLGLK
nr:hypothetical protein [Maliibacterium massiliense]